MSDESSKKPTEVTPPASSDLREILSFLRDESEKNRSTLQAQASDDRNLFKHIIWLTTAPVTVLVLIAGWLGYSNIQSLKESIRQQAKSEGTRAIAETTAELRNRVKTSIEDEFKTPNIRATIHLAAEDAARTEANSLIQQAVREQVGAAVSAHRDQIQSIAVKAVERKLDASVTPLVNQSRDTLNALHVQQLMSQVLADDASAFDELSGLATTGQVPDRDRIREFIDHRHRHDFIPWLPGGAPARCANPKGHSFMDRLHAADVSERREAIEDCGSFLSFEPGIDRRFPDQTSSFFAVQDELIPILVSTAEKDRSLTVREEAINDLNFAFKFSSGFPKEGLDNLDARGLERWWRAHQPDYRELLLISSASGPDSLRFDSVTIYDELQRRKATASRSMSEDLSMVMERMRSHAVQKFESLDLASIPFPGGRNCKTSALEVSRRFDIWNQTRDIDMFEPATFQALKFLETCPADPVLRSRLAAYIASSHSLALRYASVTVFNKWTEVKLDPFDSRQLQGWWNSRRVDLQNQH